MTPLLRITRRLLRFFQACAVISLVCNVVWYCFSHIPLILITAAFIQVLLKLIPQPHIGDLRNKAVLITGCDTGIGNALARKLDSIGIRVFAACLQGDGPGAQALKAECSERLVTLQLDVTKEEEVAAAKRTVQDALKGDEVLWGVVNNAGIAIFGEVEWLSVDMFRQVYDVNLLGTIGVTKQFLPLLRESKGRIVNACSITGRFASPFSSSYCSSKFALEALGDCLRYELQKWDIKVVTIEPGNYSMASVQFLPENMRKNLQRVWDAMPSDIQEVYGKRYFDAIASLIVDTPNISTANIDVVLDDYVKALTLQSPSSRYMPAQLAWKVLPLLLYFSPSWVGDVLFGYFGGMQSTWKLNRPGAE